MLWEKSNFDIGNLVEKRVYAKEMCCLKRMKDCKRGGGGKESEPPAQKRAVLKGPLIQTAEMPHRKFSISFTRSPVWTESSTTLYWNCVENTNQDLFLEKHKEKGSHRGNSQRRCCAVLPGGAYSLTAMHISEWSLSYAWMIFLEEPWSDRAPNCASEVSSACSPDHPIRSSSELWGVKTWLNVKDRGLKK